jgi:hypothetical protein
MLFVFFFIRRIVIKRRCLLAMPEKHVSEKGVLTYLYTFIMYEPAARVYEVIAVYTYTYISSICQWVDFSRLCAQIMQNLHFEMYIYSTDYTEFKSSKYCLIEFLQLITE